jgi:hypothetical protein
MKDAEKFKLTLIFGVIFVRFVEIEVQGDK